MYIIPWYWEKKKKKNTYNLTKYFRPNQTETELFKDKNVSCWFKLKLKLNFNIVKNFNPSIISNPYIFLQENGSRSDGYVDPIIRICKWGFVHGQAMKTKQLWSKCRLRIVFPKSL